MNVGWDKVPLTEETGGFFLTGACKDVVVLNIIVLNLIVLSVIAFENFYQFLIYMRLVSS